MNTLHLKRSVSLRGGLRKTPFTLVQPLATEQVAMRLRPMLGIIIKVQLCYGNQRTGFITYQPKP